MSLVITRKPHQTIHIGPDIKVTVVLVSRGQVRLAIDAPKDVPIIRRGWAH